MANRLRLVAISLLLITGCSNGSDNEAAFSGIEQPAATAAPSAPGATCRSDQSYRAVFTERDPATGAALVEIYHEVDGDQQRIEASNGVRFVVLGQTAWSYADDVWEQQPVVPVRPLRIPWVNNFVTGAEIKRAFDEVETISLAGIDATIYRPSLDEMTEAFADRFRDIEYDPAGTSFEYLVDSCDDVVAATVTTMFGGEEAQRSDRAGVPLTLLYTYELYDVGAPIDVIAPETSIGTIARPAD